MTDQEREELEKALVLKVKVYFRLLEFGWLHGKLGNLEAKRRNIEIKELTDKLGLTIKQRTALINKYAAKENEIA